MELFMLFNSFQFIIFLPCVIVVYYLLPHKLRWGLLLIASYYFYMAWRPEYIILIVISTLVDYSVSILIEKEHNIIRRKLLLFLSLFANLGLLFVFKYFNFFNQELGDIYRLISNRQYPIAGLKLILPMGISFYTFQTLSYTLDVYRGKRKAERHLGYFALYVTFFPQLVAGPIERSDRLLPQLKKKHNFNYANFMTGLSRICWGFFKKVVIADRIAVIVNTIYNNLNSYNGFYLIIATVGFAIQIYCDFSAYSDIAIGSAKIMGVDLMENFKVPYLAKSISEFWSRWHISLSTWFRDYLYIPLGGNRVNKKWKYYRNIMVVFLVSGFWHGANWTFIIWGFLHGFYQLVERLTKDLAKKAQVTFKLPRIFKFAITITLVMFAWIFFRANNLQDAIYVVSNISLNNITVLLNPTALYNLGLDNKDFWLLVICILFLLITDTFRYSKDKQVLVTSRFFAREICCLLLILFIVVFGYYGTYDASTFIYFQF